MSIAPSSPRVLVFLPSWLGDTVMATPTLRLLRAALPKSIIVALARPGMDELLAGLEHLDDVMVADTRKALGPAKVASRLVPQRFDCALLLPNSFASAMTVRLAGVRVRVGYERDGRGMLLTHPLAPMLRLPPHTGYEPVSAVDYYLAVARRLLEVIASEYAPLREGIAQALRQRVRLELGVTPDQHAHAQRIMSAASLEPGRFVLLNPGGNNPDKRWPVERFAGVAHHLIAAHGLRVAINGSPSEAKVVALIRDAIALNDPGDAPMTSCLHELGGTIGSLKGVVRAARLVVTNDTGPRHIAAAMGVPCVALFGPTDPRWTTLPEGVSEDGRRVLRETIVVADPTLPPEEVADDHPERCRIDRIETSRVIEAVDAALALSAG